MDVMSLYTNINHEEGIQAISGLLNSKQKNTFPMNQNLIWLLEIALKCNGFSFNGEHYIKLNDTSIETRVAPTCANHLMDFIEWKYIYKHDKCHRIW